MWIQFLCIYTLFVWDTLIYHSPNAALIPTPVENMVYANQQPRRSVRWRNKCRYKCRRKRTEDFVYYSSYSWKIDFPLCSLQKIILYRKYEWMDIVKLKFVIVIFIRIYSGKYMKWLVWDNHKKPPFHTTEWWFYTFTLLIFVPLFL